MLGPLIVIAFVLGMFVLLYVAGRLSGMRTHERVRCPGRQVDYEVTFERRLTASWDRGKPVDVAECSAFAEPGQVMCAKFCLLAQKDTAIHS